MSEKRLVNAIVKNLDELKLVGFRVLCEGDEYINEIQKASFRLSERMSEIKQVMNPSLQIGAFVVESGEAEDGYWVCIAVKEFEEIPSDMSTLTIPPQKYAALKYKGTNYKIMDVYSSLHEWIEKNGYRRLEGNWHIEKFYSWEDSEDIDVELLDTVE
ncbi:AraC family transcriptional regulator [Bacillus cereus]|uniref:GyrI-like domain-containing protein n=1 Tax=Bacillus paramycoides TaxID=2026194 RepID=UPI000BF3F002|nr:GyrI-like domain-containing protein [Bacillus paramycoides]PFD37826.1 AraC family transcriptional regulator [Bacillus cereus]